MALASLQAAATPRKQLWPWPHCKMIQPMMVGGIPQAAPMMICLPQQMQPGQQDHSNVPGFRAGMEKPVTTSAIPLYKLPKCRLTEAIEFVCPDIEVTLVASLDQQQLALIIWVLTRIKADLNITEYHAKSYLDLYMRLRSANERIKAAGNMIRITRRSLQPRRSFQSSSCRMRLALGSTQRGSRK